MKRSGVTIRRRDSLTESQMPELEWCLDENRVVKAETSLRRVKKLGFYSQSHRGHGSRLSALRASPSVCRAMVPQGDVRHRGAARKAQLACRTLLLLVAVRLRARPKLGARVDGHAAGMINWLCSGRRAARRVGVAWPWEPAQWRRVRPPVEAATQRRPKVAWLPVGCDRCGR